jgi:NodT family efflux transporter outer membrane factor (OMF) lipoprotein
MRWSVFLLPILALAGCAGPKADVPPDARITPPSAWRGGVTASEQITADWWRNFNDPALSAIVESALVHNTDIAIAATRVAAARAEYRLAAAEAMPSISATLGGGRDEDVNPGFGVQETQTTGEGSVAISYDLDLFGRLAATTASAKASLLATEEARDNVRIAVMAAAAGGYITLRGLDAQLLVLRDTLQARGEELRIAKRRLEAGYGAQLDLAQAEAAYHATEQQIPATALAVAREEDGLSLILGSSPRDIERGAELDKLVVPAVPLSLPSTLLRQRPDIAEAESQLAATDHALDAARAAFMPDVQLSANGGFVGSTLVEGSPLGVWSLGGSILAPIFSAGRLEAGQDAAVARRDQAAFNYRKAALTAFGEVENALQAVSRDQEQEQALDAQKESLAKALTLATNRYREGYSPYLDQLDAQRGLLTAQLSLVRARVDRLNALVTLYQSLGGGWRPADVIAASR